MSASSTLILASHALVVCFLWASNDELSPSQWLVVCVGLIITPQSSGLVMIDASVKAAGVSHIPSGGAARSILHNATLLAGIDTLC